MNARTFFFWGRESPPGQPPSSTCLSPWYPAPFTLEGVTYPTAEYCQMAVKAELFGDREAFGRIIAAPDPSAAMALGRQLRVYERTVIDAQAEPLLRHRNTPAGPQRLRRR